MSERAPTTDRYACLVEADVGSGVITTPRPFTPGPLFTFGPRPTT